MTIDEWNALQKDADTQSIAEPIDIVTMIDGVAFLIQRRNNWNNVICIRVKPSKRALIKTFDTFRKFCHKKHIRYIRIESGHNHTSHTYHILKLMQRTAPKSCGLVLHQGETEKYGSNVYFVKTY